MNVFFSLEFNFSNPLIAIPALAIATLIFYLVTLYIIILINKIIDYYFWPRNKVNQIIFDTSFLLCFVPVFFALILLQTRFFTKSRG